MSENFDWSKHTDLLPEVIARQQLGPFDPTPLERLPAWVMLSDFSEAYIAVLGIQQQALATGIRPRQLRKRMEVIRKQLHLGRPTMRFITEQSKRDALDLNRVDSKLDVDLAIEKEILGFTFSGETLPQAPSSTKPAGRFKRFGRMLFEGLKLSGEGQTGPHPL